MRLVDRIRIAAAHLACGLSAVALAAVGTPSRAAPLRVMSLNECTDQLLLALLPPERITSVTWLSRDPGSSQMWREARRVSVNHGLAEDVVRDRPDLVLAGTFTTPATEAMLRSLHFPLRVIAPANSFEDIRRTTLEVADAVGEPARGRALVAHLDAALAKLARDRGPPLRVAAWDGAGFSAAPGSLYDTLLRAAGARNVEAERQGVGAAAPEIERLLAASPQVLVAGEPALRRPDRQVDAGRHPLVRRYWGDRTVVVPLSAYVCGTPFSADAALSLRAQMRALAARAGSAPPYQLGWTR